MKGIVFTELMEMVESQFGIEMVDRIIQPQELVSKGVFTSVGTYPFSDLVSILGHLSQATGAGIPELEKAFGQYLAGRFSKLYLPFFQRVNSVFELLNEVDSYIHIEVKKLYPDAELPQFDTIKMDSAHIEMIYRSQRKMFPFAEGLIDASATYYQQKVKIKVLEWNHDGAEVRFLVESLG
ncbi:MAG: heme NO-binding domain-containing protein [Bacteroidia bacterium]|jgi:hypothetical protein